GCTHSQTFRHKIPPVPRRARDPRRRRAARPVYDRDQGPGRGRGLLHYHGAAPAQLGPPGEAQWQQQQVRDVRRAAAGRVHRRVRAASRRHWGFEQRL
ncbi:hypothetical protein PpBr36_00629, partial [Pyricularia pennisetigena]|uniref:hypothetical protein n=1 Tax=Pyricularia pennisetigena TaxID=1578925 RepID=UPI001152285E